MGSKSKDNLNESSDKVKSRKKKMKDKYRDESPFESDKLNSFLVENDSTENVRKHKRKKKDTSQTSYTDMLSEFTKSPKIQFQMLSDDDVFVKKRSEKSKNNYTEKSAKDHKKKKAKVQTDIFSSDNEEGRLVVDTVDLDSEERVIEASKHCENVDNVTSEEVFFEGWPKEDVKELFERIRQAIPKNDTLRYQSRVDKLEWDQIQFKSYSAEECKVKWKIIEKKLRGFRILDELVMDAYRWIEQPWTDFYKSGKNNRHPDMPKRPLTSYMLFYMDKKKKFAKRHPGLEMSKLSKIMAESFNKLSETKKQKYNEKAAAMREEFNEKMQKFRVEHPVEASKTKTGPRSKKTQSCISGPAKPLTPLKMFLEDKLKHKGENVNSAELIQEYKAKWKNMSNKKKMPWIRWSYEAETKYLEEIKLYKAENPCFEAPPFKCVLSKAEKEILQRMEGKPEKPPNSAYSLFSRIMLKDPELKEKFETPKERMQEIARLWKLVPQVEKEEYNEKVKHLLGNYKLEYANYLDSLPDDKREEELAANMPKKKSRATADPNKAKLNKKLKQVTLEMSGSKIFLASEKGTTPSPGKNPSLSPELKPHSMSVKQIERSPDKNKKKMLSKEELLSREPAQPPSEAFEILRKECIEAGFSEKKSNKMWKGMSQLEKNEYEEKLEKLKQQYIIDYRAFLKSMKPEELKMYSAAKGNLAEADEDDVEDEEERDDEESENSDNSLNSSASKPLTEIGKRKRFSSSSSSEETSD